MCGLQLTIAARGTEDLIGLLVYISLHRATLQFFRFEVLVEFVKSVKR